MGLRPDKFRASIAIGSREHDRIGQPFMQLTDVIQGLRGDDKYSTIVFLHLFNLVRNYAVSGCTFICASLTDTQTPLILNVVDALNHVPS